MVTITQGQRVPESETLVVTAPSGDYADADLILCGEPGSSEATGMYAAQFIQYGPLVYQYNTPEELGAAIVALDKNSTHDAAMLYKEEEARRLAREKGTLQPENPVAAPDAIIEPVVQETDPVSSMSDEEYVASISDTESVTPEDVSAILPEASEIPVAEPLPVMPSSTPEIAPSIADVISPPAVDVSTTTQE